MAPLRRLGFALAALTAAACTSGEAQTLSGVQSFHVRILSVDGADVPTASAPLPANRGDKDEAWTFDIEARGPSDELTAFDGLVRLSVEPGAVKEIQGEGVLGRSILLKGGRAHGVAVVTAVYGPARLWAEDLGYTPAVPGETPACSNGENDDSKEDVLIDFPADPGCAFADDNSEEGGSYAIGISQPVSYLLPRLADIQGAGSTTPYPYEGMQVQTDAPAHDVVTRVSRDGFYVTDITQEGGYNHIFAFNFSTPARMRVCDRVTYLAGTVSEFFGFTELGFPSFKLAYPTRTACTLPSECASGICLEGECRDACTKPSDCPTTLCVAGLCTLCDVPEPAVIGPSLFNPAKHTPYDADLEKLESGLARVEGFTVTSKFGPTPAVGNVFSEGTSNCDLNGDGQVDFTNKLEGSCGDACSADADCSEWTAYSARGNFKVHDDAGNMIQIETGGAPGFDPVAQRGKKLRSVTGTLRNFSGGSLNWTIEVRCQDDLVCEGEGCCPADVCKGEPLLSRDACVNLRTTDDNDIVSD